MDARLLTTLTIHLPFPDKALWPNGRPGHWAVKARSVKKARRDAYLVTLWSANGFQKPSGPVSVALTVYPKTRNAVDRDNVIAAAKSSLDGIADALKVDDSTFGAPTVTFGEPVKGGSLTVVLTYE